jgi:MFS family permease
MTMTEEYKIGAATNTGSNLHRTAVLIIILASYLMIVLDISITITTLPKLHQDIGFSATGLSWVQNAYTLAFGGLLLLSSRAGGILSRFTPYVYHGNRGLYNRIGCLSRPRG